MAGFVYAKKTEVKHKTWNVYKTTRHHAYEDFISYAKCRNITTTAVKYVKSLFETKLASKIQPCFGNMLEITQRYNMI